MASGLTYDLSFFWAGQPTNGQLAGFTATRPLSIAADMAGSGASAQNLPMSTVTLILNQNGVQVGTLVITAGGSFIFSTSGDPITVAIGDTLVWSAPSPADARLSDVAITIEAVETDSYPAGYVLGFEIDFDALPNQTISVDGPVTVGGFSCAKANSANETAAMAVVNGTGLVIQPAHGNSYDATHRTAPLLYLAPQASISDLDWTSPSQIWVEIGNQNFTYDGDQAVVSLEESTSPMTFQALGMAFDGAPSLAWFAAAAAAGVSSGAAQSPVAGKTVGVLELPGGPAGGINLYDGNYAAGWPTHPALQLEAAARQFGGVGFAQVGSGVMLPPLEWTLALAAFRSGSNTSPALSVAFKKLKYLYQAR